ncbi:MAG: hypothetical protein KJ578_06230 [Bacteroidetes bacterium]|nr:hypothetical protein [Bacteroidota bacterium]MBU1578341.1 hypothetical protein [Bacteroidota bacterium]MBU2466747.1 hypothetical protein [Bacteroidota bacterium]MBU2557358.1 hypothetical protein [Bacteroidota bacterium]
MQEVTQKLVINKLGKHEAIRAYEYFIAQLATAQFEDEVLTSELQVVGNEIVEYMLDQFPDSQIGFVVSIDHNGVVLSGETDGIFYAAISALFSSDKPSLIGQKLALIADEIIFDDTNFRFQFVLESDSLNRKLAAERIQTLESYFNPKKRTNLRIHDSF